MPVTSAAAVEIQWCLALVQIASFNDPMPYQQVSYQPRTNPLDFPVIVGYTPPNNLMCCLKWHSLIEVLKFRRIE